MYICQSYSEMNGQIEETHVFNTLAECTTYSKRAARIVNSLRNGWDTRINVAIYEIELKDPLKIITTWQN